MWKIGHIPWRIVCNKTAYHQELQQGDKTVNPICQDYIQNLYYYIETLKALKAPQFLKDIKRETQLYVLCVKKHLYVREMWSHLGQNQIISYCFLKDISIYQWTARLHLGLKRKTSEPQEKNNYWIHMQKCDSIDFSVKINTYTHHFA